MANLTDKAKQELVNYLLSDEYFWLLERAILSRLSTSTNNCEQHRKAANLLLAAKEGRTNHEKND